MRSLRLLPCLIAIAALSGCGYKGPLIAAPATPASAVSALAAPATTASAPTPR